MHPVPAERPDGAGGLRSPVVELRQYALRPGRRDDLIDLFDREFVETQEVLGMAVLGQFRDLDDPDRFVWVRGFPDMASRATALAAFYDGPVWQQHREAANDTMIDSDDVLLLRPFGPAVGRPLPARPAGGATHPGASTVIGAVYPLARALDPELGASVHEAISAALDAAGVELRVWYETESAENTFPRLPVRAGEQVLVWFGSVATDQQRAVAAGAELTAAEQTLGDVLSGDPQRLRLTPTTRSRLR